MYCRRDVLIGASAAIAVLPIASCSSRGMADYDGEAARLRQTLSANPDMLELLRYATLAPNGYNSQPWQFLVDGRNVSIMPDLSRRTPVVDPDDHHLFVSLGCAAENLLLAGAASGLPGAMRFWDSGDGRIDTALETGKASDGVLSRAIPRRQSTRSVYDGRAVATDQLKQLEAAARQDGVSLVIMTDPKQREAVLEQVIAGNSQQMDDPAFVRELKQWIRFNPGEALETRDGLFSATSGNQTAPKLIGKTMFGSFFKKEDENRKYAAQIRSSAGLAIFIGDKADKTHWVDVGRSAERFLLQATALNIQTAMINQPVEAPDVRADFARWLGVPDKRPDLVIRFGYAPLLPMSLRRPVDDLVIPWQRIR
jgi:nitroreductase